MRLGRWGRPEPDPPIDEKFRRVTSALHPGLLGDSASIVEVRRDGDAAVVLLDHPGEDKPLGVVIDLVDTSRELYYSDTAVDSFDEWVADLRSLLAVAVGSGAVRRSRRVDRGAYVEVRVGT